MTPTRPRKYKRQAILFFVAVLVPAVVFVGLAFRVLQQDAELAKRRTDDERSAAVDRVRRELSSRLKEIELAQINRQTPGEGASSDSPNPALVFAGPVEDGRIHLPRTVSQGKQTPGHALWEAQRAEQLESLARDLDTIRSRIDSAVAADTVWIPYGFEPWLITITATTPPLLLVVSSQQVAPDTILVEGETPAGFELGGSLPNLSVQFAPGRFVHSETSLPAPLLIAALLLILGVMLLVGYLLLRDLNREVGIAELRTAFVADVSHEIKTPLTAIRLYADKLALGRSLDERTRSEYVNTIVNESERLSRLVDNVLAFSEIESGARVYYPKPVCLTDVVESAARAIAYLLTQRGFVLKISIEENIPVLNVDADAMEQATLNLLINAMKYSGDARQIDLRLRHDKKEVIIEVADQGVGIDPRDQASIFEKFHRVRTADTGHVAGTGLGLALVRHIVTAHRGRVAVVSQRGKGSTFSIHLPAASGEVPA